MRFLVKEIKIYSIFKHRSDYLFEIQKHCIEKGINLECIGLNETTKVKNIHSSNDEYSNLRLKNGTSVTKNELLQEIKNFDDIVDLMEKGWVYKINNEYLNSNLKFNTFENLFILTEYTSIKGQGDGYTSEVRQSFIDIQEFKENINNELIFNSSTKEQISDYPFIEIQFLCFYNWSFIVFNKKINWIAFNPMLAEEMGFKLS